MLIITCFPAGIKSEIILGQCPVHELIKRTFLEKIFGK